MSSSVSPSPPFASTVLLGGVFAVGDVAGGVCSGGVFAGGVYFRGVCSGRVF